MHYTVIGISNNPDSPINDEVKSLLPSHRLFSGGKRQYELVREQLPFPHEWIAIKKDMKELFEQYKQRNEPIVVFASGDPLFYGFANTIKKYDPDAQLNIYPYFNSLQLLCHRCNIPYHHISNASVHGRSWNELDEVLIEQKELIGVLTDAEKSPAVLAQRLIDYGFDQYSMIVGESLDSPEESVKMLSLQEAVQSKFHALNCVLLMKQFHKNIPFGIPDEAFTGFPNRPTLITKMPVRITSLSQLDLKNRKTFWDIGFCTASVSIEAKRQFPWLAVTAFEKRKECSEIFDINTRKFSAPGIQKVMQDFFEADLHSLQAPSAVFIGGHGNRLYELIERIGPYLLPKGRLVINAVKDESVKQFTQVVQSLGYTLLSRIHLRVDEHNPITILTAEKP
jgi:precorrin-6Y C5,15-methyltransferase (decarboxylating)